MNLQVNRNRYTCVKAVVDTEFVQLVGFGDLHIGAKTYNEKKAFEVRDYIKDNNCIWLGMGDFQECATKRSVGSGVYDQTMTPEEQVNYTLDLLTPIADKCIGYVKGNHEERIYKDTGIDIGNWVCGHLGIPYNEWEFFGIISAPKKCYTVYAIHSYTSAKTGGLALNKTEQDIEKMLGSVDIIMKGHTHKRIVHLTEYFDINVFDNSVVVKQRANLITGHFLEREGSYAASKPMRGDPAGTIALQLDMNRHRAKSIKPIYL